METFRKRYVVERTNKAEIRLGEQSENTESCRENLWNEIQVKGPKREIDARTEEWASSVGLCQGHKP